MVSKPGLMVLDMKGTGLKDKLVDKENSFMPQGRCIQATGLTIKPVAKERIQHLMEAAMMASGGKIYKMVSESKPGLMIRFTKGSL